MSDVEIRLEGTKELLANLKRIDSDIRGEVARKAVHAGAENIKGQAVINAPVLTGALRNSAIVTSSNEGGNAEALIKFRREYARIQEFGGTITAKNKPYLVFKVGGKWVRKKSVKINGKHYLENAINSQKGAAVKAMGDVINQYLER